MAGLNVARFCNAIEISDPDRLYTACKVGFSSISTNCVMSSSRSLYGSGVLFSQFSLPLVLRSRRTLEHSKFYELTKFYNQNLVV